MLECNSNVNICGIVIYLKKKQLCETLVIFVSAWIRVAFYITTYLYMNTYITYFTTGVQGNNCRYLFLFILYVRTTHNEVNAYVFGPLYPINNQ